MQELLELHGHHPPNYLALKWEIGDQPKISQVCQIKARLLEEEEDNGFLQYDCHVSQLQRRIHKRTQPFLKLPL